ncbi:hypothetical protein [Staphylococcus simulans]|uniref:hypothetical protein n=3 Tax=Staphylococcus simulans TaxID=1286 RepID=UPI000D03B39E|nr:hypothetical protein [Staphylococcus simulans]AVO02093.1 hypothetical protein BI282_06685 [Staphylococcus simulans]AVO05039.1 hypothetical protein BI283_06650 [Staphylococcus simulans]AWG18644.1 hypothetical protein A9958_06700 [Staphylococcus simulans]AWI01604.1 hypothetical protein A7X73_06650 [Staphylococcus simulans]MCE5024109.1 hypothetical protein [Staphylococcus simulans]
MKKKFISIIGATILLTGCGSQNLGPLEQKTTKLRDDNHQLKLENQELEQNISDLKDKEKQLGADKKNTKEAAQNSMKTKNANATSDYYQKVTDTLKDYHKIESDVQKNKRKEAVVSKLDKIVTDLQSAHDKYKIDLEKSSMSDKDKSDNKNIEELNNKLVSAFKTIRDGYSTKSDKKIKKGQQELAQIKVSKTNS